MLAHGIIKLCWVYIMLIIWHLIFMHFFLLVNIGVVGDSCVNEDV